VSDDSEGSEQGFNFYSDEETIVDSDNAYQEHPTPIFHSPQQNESSDEDEEALTRPASRRRKTVVEDSDDEHCRPGKPKEDFPERLAIPQTPMSQSATPMRATRASRNARQYLDDEQQLQEGIARSLLSLSSQPIGPVFTEEDEDEGINEEETEWFCNNFMQQGQWRVVYLDEAWQLAKRCLFANEDLPKKVRKHPSLHSYVVAPNVVPKKITKIIGDGSCLFRAISFALFRDQESHRLVRSEILKHMARIWDENDRVRLLAAMWGTKTKPRGSVTSHLPDLY